MPLGSSLLVVVGLTILKRVQSAGASAWTATILMCWASAIVFSSLTFMGGTLQPWELWWQPAMIGALFVAGQLLTLLAVKAGDVSIATPVLGVKVLLVPGLSTILVAEIPALKIWAAAAVAMVGIVCVQASDATVDRSKILISVVLAVFAALAMTIFDLLIQKWAPAWGPGYFLPIAFGFAAVLACGLLPLADPPKLVWKQRSWWPWLFWGSVLMSVQAIGMTFTVAKFGDATRVNIVYSLRGLWGVLLTWLLLHLSSAGDTISNRVMTMRLIGAVLIGVAVLVAIL